MDKYMKCLLWVLLGPPLSFYLGLLIPLLLSITIGSGFEMDRPHTAFESHIDSLIEPLVFVLITGGCIYSLRKAYLTLRDG
jgi:Na+/H+-dicarboxylate symporter